MLLLLCLHYPKKRIFYLSQNITCLRIRGYILYSIHRGRARLCAISTSYLVSFGRIAAECAAFLIKVLFFRYKVRAGDHEIHSYESTEQEQFPVEVHVHPGYRHAPYYENDIALVKLNQTVHLSPYVRTVCLPMTNEDLAKPGAVGTLAGWGKTESGLHSSTLHHSTYMIQNNTFCDRATNYFFNSTVTFCAGDGKGKRDTCHGDSGGSMVRNVLVNGRRRWVTVGLVSWGEGCALKDKYGYYTRLQPFVDWIRHKMNDSSKNIHSVLDSKCFCFFCMQYILSSL